MQSMKKTIFALTILLANLALAEEAQEKLWINPGFISYHFDRDMGFNEKNYGLGLEYTIDNKWSVAIGRFKNSEYHMSNYFTAIYQPIHYGNFKFGGGIGVVNGYKGLYNEKSGDYFPMLSPILTYEKNKFGVNFLLIPEIHMGQEKIYGTVAIQLKYQIK